MLPNPFKSALALDWHRHPCQRPARAVTMAEAFVESGGDGVGERASS
jgi:hypothetical protein